MATFSQTSNPTPFGFYDADAQFSGEADAMVLYVKRKLGDDILDVELTKKQIWACFEESFTHFGYMINKYQTKSQLATLIGQESGSFTSSSVGISHKLPRGNLSFLTRLAEPYIEQADLGGSYNSELCYLQLSSSQQDYNLYTGLIRASDNIKYFPTLTGSQVTKLRIVEVYHFSPSTAYRFFDSTSAVNYLNNEFSFESFTPETIFYVLPVFEDILRAGQMDLSMRVRRSNYSYRISGENIRIFPTPSVDPATKKRRLYIRVMPFEDPFNPAFKDNTIYGISNLSNIPYGNLEYSRMNSIGRHWTRQYARALATELLGLVRSKFSAIPIPGSEVSLNGTELVANGREDQLQLKTELMELLESLTYDKLVEIEATKTENLIRQLKGVPVPLGKVIIMG